jgi:flagellar export protein FliJ
MTDTLATLHRLRRLTADQARRHLAACLSTVHAAEAKLEAAQTAVAREAATAPTDAAHPLAGSYALWLPAAQAHRVAAAQAVRAAEADLTGARTALAEARAATTAVDHLIADHTAASHRAAQRREQASADDLAGALKERPGGSAPWTPAGA